MAPLGSPDDVARSPGEAIDEALHSAATSHYVEVEGTSIHYRVWEGSADAVPVLLIHGMLAHTHWWDAVAGWLSKDRRVVAMDFSGMGGSGRRAHYSRAQHAREILAVAEDAELDNALLVAHSYGGDPAIRACRAQVDLFDELLLLDCRLMLPGVVSATTQTGMGELTRKVFSSPEEARQRFRLMPESPFVDPSLLEHVFSHSLMECDGGWTWKYDAAVATQVDPNDPLLVDGLKIPVTFVRGAESIATPALQMEVTRRNFPFAEMLEIPACGHHLMLDQPVALTTLLRSKLH